MRRMWIVVLVLAGATLSAGTVGAKAEKKKAEPAPTDLIDVSAQRPKMKLVTDGNGHYMAFVPFGRDADEDIFWGDGKDFWKQRRIGWGAEGDIKFDITFWEPRVGFDRWKAAFDYKDKKYSVRCEDRVTELKLVEAGEAKQIIERANFHDVRWKTQGYALARDDKGTYYYVDRMREPEGNKNFRVFIGQRGAMKPAKMKNIVSDSQGEIFITKNGELRLILDKSESSWTKGKKTTKLTVLPVEDNVKLIYSELGAYTGENLGTPCDDI